MTLKHVGPVAGAPRGVHPETPPNPIEGGTIGDTLARAGERPAAEGRVRFGLHDVYMHYTAESFGTALRTWSPVGGRIHFVQGPNPAEIEFTFQGQSNDIHCLILDADRALEVNLLDAYAKELKLKTIFGGGISIDSQDLVHEEFGRNLPPGARSDALKQYLDTIESLGREGAALIVSKGFREERFLAYVRNGRFIDFKFSDFSELNETLRPLLDAGYVIVDETESLSAGAGIAAPEIYRQKARAD
ncbi:MAG: hypothetical protein K1X83_02395 [Oligoflexia bacterium]|nr:hypothetical protein [Oligoflexia bacterium]